MSGTSPKPRWSARMGSVMRRTSSVLTISRPSSVSSDRDADSASLSGSTKGSTKGREASTLSPPPPPPVLSTPSPIAESPLREAAAVSQEAVGRSPLAQPITSSEVVPPTLPPPIEEIQSPTGYIPPPVIDFAAGNPGAFTDVADELPQPDIVQDPYAVAPVDDPTVSNPGPSTDEAAKLPQPDVAPDHVTPPAEETQNPTGYIPPPVIDSTAGNPGAFTDVTDELPEPDVAQDPRTVAPVDEVEKPTGYIPPPVIDSTAGNFGSFTDMVNVPPPVIAQDPHAVAPVEPHVEQPAEPEPLIAEALVEEPASYFDGPMTESVIDFEPTDHADDKRGAVDENANTISTEPYHGEAAEYYHDVIPTTQVVHENVNVVFPEPDLGQREEPEAHYHDDFVPVTTEREIQEETQQKTEPIIVPVPVPNYDMPSYPMNLGSGQEVWGGEHDYGPEGLSRSYASVPIVPSSENLKQVERSPAPSIRMPEADPFADPIAPRITVSQSALDMPQPEFAEGHHQDSAETQRDIYGPVVMPLPSFYEVAASKPIHHAPSTSSLRNEDTRKFGNLIETDETLPLLSRPGSPAKHKPTSYLQTSTQPQSRNHVSVSPHIYTGSQSTTSNGHANSWHPHPGAHPRLHNLGWLEYHLPDGTVYYVHPTNRVTTEINLRSERMLTGVERFLVDRGKDPSASAMEGVIANGGEIWLRDIGTAKSGMILERWWVDHRLRTVVMGRDDYEYDRKGTGKGKATKGGAVLFEEDQLDTEYRYWSFMEAHPAHNSLPAKAKVEAMDVLTWAWTERLLPSHRAVPAPFTQEECQELMTLIRSFGEDHGDHGIQTRIVSRVLLRVAHWRQSYFRPNKPLPTNVGANQSRLPIIPRQPFRRVFFDFVVSCLFLGIPYIFFERSRLSSRIDEETGLRSVTPTLVIGACTCLVAAVVLSASVTFLSLPGLDAFSRTTGMVAILLAAFSMAATVVAIFGFKADLERPISHLGVEGMMVITRRTVILSLPLVLLVYSILAFITSIVLYSLRGVTFSDPSMTKKSFEQYTKWGVVSVVGVLAGMVTTSVLLFRR